MLRANLPVSSYSRSKHSPSSNWLIQRSANKETLTISTINMTVTTNECLLYLFLAVILMSCNPLLMVMRPSVNHSFLYIE